MTRFRADCLRELEKTKRAWPNLDYSTVAGALVLAAADRALATSQYSWLREKDRLQHTSAEVLRGAKIRESDETSLVVLRR